ncbi:MAG: helix-turn-helix domain-containing protein [Cellulosilyticum sp.]|nr:helix-turn-helix domain-containing protein [Cellulosilyticum sp.]
MMELGNLRQKDILTVMEIAIILEIGRNSAYKLVKEQPFPVKTIGKKKVIPASTFFEWLNNGQNEAIDW